MRSTQRHNFLSNIRNFIERTHAGRRPRSDPRLSRSVPVIELVEAPEGIKFLRTCRGALEILTVHFRVPAPSPRVRFPLPLLNDDRKEWLGASIRLGRIVDVAGRDWFEFTAGSDCVPEIESGNRSRRGPPGGNSIRQGATCIYSKEQAIFVPCDCESKW
jgi:hypothetical protein